MIDLFLFRHGIATEPEPDLMDSQRPLTDEGIQKTRRIAKRLKALDLQFDLILSSPFLRAKQTAEILLEARLGQTLRLSEDLAPSGTLENWVSWFLDWQVQGGNQLVLVGHQPNLGQWAEWLCWGESHDCLTVKKAGIVGIKVPLVNPLRGQCQLFWLAPPKLLL